MTYKEIKKNQEVLKLLEKGDQNLEVLGFTEHSMVHSCKGYCICSLNLSGQIRCKKK